MLSLSRISTARFRGEEDDDSDPESPAHRERARQLVIVLAAGLILERVAHGPKRVRGAVVEVGGPGAREEFVQGDVAPACGYEGLGAFVGGLGRFCCCEQFALLGCPLGCW